MKLSIQRHGIVIRSVEIRGDSARIGSAPDCEVALDDPYLAAHVADLVKRADGWYIVDSAASLEGVTRNGVRIDEEPLAGGEPYTVGGFEIVAQVDPARAAAAPKTMVEPMPDASYPKTMMETELPPSSRDFPKTMMETELPPEIRGDVAPQARGETPRNVAAATPAAKGSALPGFQPVVTSPGTKPASAAKPAGSKRLLLVAGILGGAIVLLVIIGIATSGKDKKPAAQPVATETAPPVAPAEPPVAAPVPAAKRGEEFLARLQPDQALAAWESGLTEAPDPALQDRYAAIAVELGMLHAAANDRARANAYFERAVKFGRAESDAVKLARARLAS